MFLPAYPLIHPRCRGYFLRSCLERVFYGARGVACYSKCDVCHTLLMVFVRLQGVGAGRTSGVFPWCMSRACTSRRGACVSLPALSCACVLLWRCNASLASCYTPALSWCSSVACARVYVSDMLHVSRACAYLVCSRDDVTLPRYSPGALQHSHCKGRGGYSRRVPVVRSPVWRSYAGALSAPAYYPACKTARARTVCSRTVIGACTPVVGCMLILPGASSCAHVCNVAGGVQWLPGSLSPGGAGRALPWRSFPSCSLMRGRSHCCNNSPVYP